MTVCFISNASTLGGAERVLLETIDVLRKRGVRCRVLAAGDGELVRVLTAGGVPCAVHRVGSWVSWHKPSLWDRVKTIVKIGLAVRAAAKQIRAWNCDAIYSNSLTVCHGALVAKLMRLPHIWHLHEFGGEENGIYYHFGEAFSNRAIGALSSVCIVVSQALAAKYRRYMPPDKVVVLYPSMHMARCNLTNRQSESPCSCGHSARLRLLIIGGLGELKGQVDAVEALACLVQDGIDCELDVVGESYPAYRGRLEKAIRHNGLAERVHFTGRVSDAAPFLRAADVLLVCSRSEAFGRVTIEAMFAETPVIGARCGATAELIQDGVTGLLYNCGDSLDLAAKVRFLYNNPDLSQQIGQNGRRWAAGRFDESHYADAVVGVLTSASCP